MELTKIGNEAAKVAADRLIGFFPTLAATDPAVFIAGLVVILAAYPVGVVEAVLSPLSGVPSKHAFMPSLSEVKAECEMHFGPYRREVARPHPLPALPAPTFERPTLDELRAKHGPNWGLQLAPENDEARCKRREMLSRRANKTFLERECADVGVNPARAFSPVLEALIRERSMSDEIADPPGSRVTKKSKAEVAAMVVKRENA